MKAILLAFVLLCSGLTKGQNLYGFKEHYDYIMFKGILNGQVGYINYLKNRGGDLPGSKWGDELAPINESLISMFLTTGDKDYLFKSLILAKEALNERTVQYDEGYYGWSEGGEDNSRYQDMIAIWPIAHAIYLISTEQPSLKTVPVPDFLAVYYQGLLDLEDVANYLTQEINVTMNFHSLLLFSQNLGFKHGLFTGKAAQLNQNVLCALPFLYTGLTGNFNHLVIAKRIAELLKTNLVFTDNCPGSCLYDFSYDAPIFLNGPNNSFWYYTNGWYLETTECFPCSNDNSFDYAKAVEASEDVSHAVNTMYFIYEAYKQGLTINNNNDLFLNDAEMEKFRRMFLNNIYDITDSNGITKFNLRVDGTNTYLDEDDSHDYNGYKNLISAFMPFYQFDYNGTVKSTTTYDLILQTMKNVWEGGNPNNPNNPRSALDFLSSSAIDGYGFSQVVSAQWDKECVDLVLFNRNLTNNQDFHAKHILTINTLEDIPYEFLYDSDFLFNPNTNQKSTALPVYQNSNFTIPSGVTANITAGNSVSLKGEVHFMSGSEVSIATVTSNCYSGGRNNSTNSEDSDLIDSSKIQERNQKIDFDSISFRKNQIIVSPNPFTSTVNIEISLEDISFKFELQNQSGEILRSGILKNGKNTLNFSELPNGIYILCIHSGNKFEKYKLIKI